MPIRYSYADIHTRVEELLADRLNKLGSITTKDAWLICREDPAIQYSSLTVHFKHIMMDMVSSERADVIGRGQYFIYRNNYSHEKGL